MTTRDRLIEKLFQGTCTREELIHLMDIIKYESSDIDSESEIMKKLWNTLESDPDLDEYTATVILDKTLNKITFHKRADHDHVREIYNEENKRNLQKKWLLGGSIAAAILFVVGIIMGYQHFTYTDNVTQTTTGFGEWKSLTLPDGSVVILNANSSISYAENWKKETRNVKLEGEAFFKIAKDEAGTTFTVSTKDIGIVVLGTTFNVHTRGDKTNVFLEEGKVKLKMDYSEKLLSPGDFVSYSSSQKTITSYHKSLSESHTSWKDGSLIMTERRVEDIFEKIEEIYGYEVKTLDNNLLSEVKTIAIPMDRIEIAIPILEKVLNVNIEINEGQLMVKK